LAASSIGADRGRRVGRMEECGPPLSTEESPRGPRRKGGVKGGGESSGKDEMEERRRRAG